MRNWLKIVFVVSAFVAPAKAGASDDCDCPKLTCNFECEYEQSVTFYSEKCAGGTKVRSCARPTCLPLPNAPKTCGMSQNETPAPARTIASEKAKGAEPASAESVVVGEVASLEGKAWRLEDARKVELKKGTTLNETDRVVTGDNSKIEILLRDGNRVTLTANSELELSKLNFSDDIQKRNTLLKLIKGRVRSQVKQKYEGTTTSFYRVKTRAAVAGVRGTDYIVTLEQIDNDLVTKVETFTGAVELSTPLREDKVLIGKAQSASYVAKDMARLGPASEDIEADFAAKGYMTPVTSLSLEQMHNLERETTANYVASRKPTNNAQNDGPICSAPAGHFNQCSWTCESNPKGEKTCRTDLPQVNCIRRVCNANGHWSAAARLPAAYGNQCAPDQVVVADCDF